MALSTRKALVARKASLDAATALLNSGKLRIYSGAQPATPETAASGTLLAELDFPNPAFGATDNSGVATAGAIASTTALATGTAGYARLLKSDGATAVYDLTVGTSGANINLNSADIQAGATVSVTGLTLTAPMQGA